MNGHFNLIFLGKRPCRHGASCYRKNPIHLSEYSHPGDADLESVDEDEDGDEDDNRPECEHGTACYRKNPEHKMNFKHTRVPQPRRKAKVRKQLARNTWRSKTLTKK